MFVSTVNVLEPPRMRPVGFALPTIRPCILNRFARAARNSVPFKLADEPELEPNTALLNRNAGIAIAKHAAVASLLEQSDMAERIALRSGCILGRSNNSGLVSAR